MGEGKSPPRVALLLAIRRLSAIPAAMDPDPIEPARAAPGAPAIGRFESLLFRPVPLWVLLAFLFLWLGGTVAYGAFILHAVKGGTRLAWLQGPALMVADAPSLVRNMGRRGRDPFLSPEGTGAGDGAGAGAGAGGAAGGRPGLTRTGFVDPGYLLVPGYDPARGRALVRLVRLGDGRVLREYAPDLAPLQAEAERRATAATPVAGIPFWMGHPDLLEDGSILFKGNNLLARASACGAVRWTRYGFHHSVERGADGRAFWTAMLLAGPPREGAGPAYRGEGIGEVGEDGRVISARTLDAIFAANGLTALLRGQEYSDDPYHLNDVEPVRADGPYWKRGDVFLSLAHKSMVLLYRPATGRILWWRIGPWMGQHDVQVLDGRRIAVFDNRVSFDAGGPKVIGSSRELVLDFATGQVSSPWEAAFRARGIRAASNGRGTVLAGGDLVIEDSMGGEAMRVGQSGEMRWRYVNGDAKGRRYRLFWSRYLDPMRYGAAVKAAAEARC